jgi:hypothetical protein
MSSQPFDSNPEYVKNLPWGCIARLCQSNIKKRFLEFNDQDFVFSVDELTNGVDTARYHVLLSEIQIDPIYGIYRYTKKLFTAYVHFERVENRLMGSKPPLSLYMPVELYEDDAPLVEEVIFMMALLS